jgi:hypothetical protein
MAEDSAAQQATAPAKTAETSQGSGSRDPIVLALIVLLVIVYVVGQWLVFSALDAKLQVIEQRVVDTSDRLDTKVDELDKGLAKVARMVRAVQASRAAPAPAALGEGDQGARPETAAAVTSPQEKPGAQVPAQPAKPAP